MWKLAIKPSHNSNDVSPRQCHEESKNKRYNFSTTSLKSHRKAQVRELFLVWCQSRNRNEGNKRGNVVRYKSGQKHIKRVKFQLNPKICIVYCDVSVGTLFWKYPVRWIQRYSFLILDPDRSSQEPLELSSFLFSTRIYSVTTSCNVRTIRSQDAMRLGSWFQEKVDDVLPLNPS